MKQKQKTSKAFYTPCPIKTFRTPCGVMISIGQAKGLPNPLPLLMFCGYRRAVQEVQENSLARETEAPIRMSTSDIDMFDRRLMKQRGRKETVDAGQSGNFAAVSRSRIKRRPVGKRRVEPRQRTFPADHDVRTCTPVVL